MSNDIRRTIQASMKLNESYVDSLRITRDALTAEEKALVETLRNHPAFASFDKSQLDRHTLKHLFCAISDQPAGVCERTASKVEKMLEKGTMSDNLISKKSLTEAEDVPVEKPEIKDGDGEMKQGPADSTAGEHDGKDVGKAAQDMPKGDSDQGADQKKDKHGDKSDIAKDGYMSEKDEEDDLPDEDDVDEDADGVGDAKDDKDPQLGEEGIDTEDPAKAGKAAKDLPEDDDDDDEDDEDDEDDLKDEAAPPPVAPAAAPAPAPAAAPAPAPAPAMKKEKCKESKIRKLRAKLEAIKNELKALKEDEVPKDAKDPASDDEHRAANDATYKDGKKQNETKVNEDDLKQPDETKDASDLPDLDNVQKEDPSNSDLNKGPVDPKLESLNSIEERICSILRESGLKKGTPRWVEAYTRGWNLAMEHRARKLAEAK